jgi:hypothetical protein
MPKFVGLCLGVYDQKDSTRHESSENRNDTRPGIVHLNGDAIAAHNSLSPEASRKTETRLQQVGIGVGRALHNYGGFFRMLLGGDEETVVE